MASSSSASPPEEEFDYLKLISAEGHEFFLDKKIAFGCEMIRTMFDGEKSHSFTEGQTGAINFQTINSRLLEKVIQYLYYKHKHTDSREAIPDFEIDDEIVLDLLLVANYLHQ
ncbi:unnamed protein product [Vitrella brassicaformis CCMP3155]|uniref:Elongin-C n=2 Tax=Vitrella brassicaformis TaxID=1169539 RepID=A0A0G4EP36_VITBC|nr:unnamed protein product [Vitrella brassicaformis CCMP3155]|eukprot:CEL99189.1 unnamed protein product [Vitrella brassicaformis CCMP3155]